MTQYKFFHKGQAVKTFLISSKKSAGRNSSGHITVWHRGGGHSKITRHIDFCRNFLVDVPAVVRRLEIDKNRGSHLALIFYRSGGLSYVLASEGLKPGHVISTFSASSAFLDTSTGNCFQLGRYPLGMMVFNIEASSGFGGCFSRSAGTGSKLLRRYANYVLLRLPSNEHRLINSSCFATSGKASNAHYNAKKINNKAGLTRHMGFRPVVRGVAMNPVDHPHGGDTSGGRVSVSPWARYTKGFITRQKPNKFAIK